MLTVVQGLHAAPDRLWFELSFGLAASGRYPGKHRVKFITKKKR